MIGLSYRQGRTQFATTEGFERILGSQGVRAEVLRPKVANSTTDTLETRDPIIFLFFYQNKKPKSATQSRDILKSAGLKKIDSVPQMIKLEK